MAYKHKILYHNLKMQINTIMTFHLYQNGRDKKVQLYFWPERRKTDFSNSLLVGV